jgi:peptidoglycan/xylan/chitin deacetylase (PgdA/CDA1 family)
MLSEDGIKKISKAAGYFRKPGTQGITPILTYHGVSRAPLKNCVTIERFLSHLDFISQAFKIIRLSELVAHIQSNKEDGRNYIAITFDDAYQNFYHYAYPELKKRNISAALFVPAGLVGQYNSWDYDQKKNYPLLKIMNWEELKDLDSSLIEIGSHGYTHRRMAFLKEDEIKTEVIQSKAVLESGLNRRIETFAYPYGELINLDHRTTKALKVSGYRFALSTHFGRKHKPADLFSLSRISIWDNDDVEDVRAKLTGGYDWLAAKERLGFILRKMERWIKISFGSGYAKTV